MFMETKDITSPMSKSIILNILATMRDEKSFVELQIDNKGKYYFIYGRVIDFDDRFLFFMDRIDGRVGISIDSIKKIRKADAGKFKMSISEFDRMCDKKLGISS